MKKIVDDCCWCLHKQKMEEWKLGTWKRKENLLLSYINYKFCFVIHNFFVVENSGHQSVYLKKIQLKNC